VCVLDVGKLAHGLLQVLLGLGIHGLSALNLTCKLSVNAPANTPLHTFQSIVEVLELTQLALLVLDADLSLETQHETQT
jgi:hypothetical protein